MVLRLGGFFSNLRLALLKGRQDGGGVTVTGAGRAEPTWRSAVVSLPGDLFEAHHVVRNRTARLLDHVSDAASTHQGSVKRFGDVRNEWTIKFYYYWLYNLYLRSSGLSFSVKNVTAFPWWPALPVRPANTRFQKKNRWVETRGESKKIDQSGHSCCNTDPFHDKRCQSLTADWIKERKVINLHDDRLWCLIFTNIWYPDIAQYLISPYCPTANFQYWYHPIPIKDSCRV